MSKGTMTEQYKVGGRIEFLTSHVEKVFATKTDKNGKEYSEFERKIRTPFWLEGSIVKIHKAGRYGVAEIKPIDGSKKIGRKLQNVRNVTA